MQAKENHLYRLLDGTDKKFIIPVYQRSYSWKKQNCELLLQDLRTVYEKNFSSHFFGSIVYVENDAAGCNEYIIIDGQQRITTVCLLLLAIRNYINDNPGIDTGVNPDKITKAYLTDEYAKDEKKLKLKLIEGDDAAYDQLIQNAEPISNNSISVNYLYFYEEISKLSATQIKGLYDSVMKLMVVNISLKPQNGDDPQLIFESLNSTGLGLSEADKIRNYVLMNMSANEQEKFYKNYWEKLENIVSKNNVDIFIRYYLSVKRRELANERTLYFPFKEFRRDFKGSTEDLLKDMLKYAKYYQEIRIAKGKGDTYLATLARINKLQVNTSYPLIFDLYEAKNSGKLNENEFCEALKIIESYVVRRFICGLSTNPLNKIFVSLGAEIEKAVEKYDVSYLDAFVAQIISITGKSRFPSDRDLEDKFATYELYNAKPYLKKYIFERLENSSTKELIAVEEQIDEGTLTIEHIMPQKMTPDWKAALGQQWELVYSKYKDTPGNLTLTAYNSEYSNLVFEKKRDMPQKGIKYSKLFLNEYVKECDVWTEKQILERANILLEVAKKCWRYPDTTFSLDQNEIKQFWDDEDISVREKDIKKIILFNDEMKVSGMNEAFEKIVMTVYGLDPVYFASFEDDNVSNEKGDFAKCFTVGEKTYINSKLDVEAEITFIQKLFEFFNLDSNDLQYVIKSGDEFDIKDEKTWYYGKVGNAAKQMITDLLKKRLISQNEIEKLKTKEHCRATFKKNVYPVLADSYDANSNSKTHRYYKEPVVIDGTNYYITSQWIEDSREDLIEWYVKHINQ